MSLNFTKVEFRAGEATDDFSLNFPKIEHRFADQSSAGEFANAFSLNFTKIEHKFADQSSTGEFTNDFSLNFTKIEHKFADQSSAGEFANDFSLNFTKIEHKFADQSSAGEFANDFSLNFTKIEHNFADEVFIKTGVADSGVLEQPSPEQSVLSLPQQALQHIVSAGALQHLPDPIAPTITPDTAATQTVFGQDGIHDIFVFDAHNLGSETDSLVNWDPGEDMLAIVNFNEGDVVGVKVDFKTQDAWLNINDTDVAHLGVMPAGDILSMVATFPNDPFALV
jgi:type VI protein secretion system component Hcp